MKRKKKCAGCGYRLRVGVLCRKCKTEKRSSKLNSLDWIIQRITGMSRYADYLHSKLWKSIKRRVYETGQECEICSKQSTVIHHQAYDEATLLGKSLRCLVKVCQECHYNIHFDGDKKRPFSQAVKICEKLLKKASHLKPKPKPQIQPVRIDNWAGKTDQELISVMRRDLAKVVIPWHTMAECRKRRRAIRRARD